MIEAASLGVGVGWQDAGAVRGMKDLQREVADTARTSNSQMKLMEQGAKNALGSMGKMLSGLGIGLGLAAIGGAAIKLGKELVRAGSDAEEMLGKFNVVMGAQAGAVTEQLAAFGAAVGRSKFDLQEMAAGVQDTFVPLGFARDEASKMSVTLTKLATDVASFNNASDPEVMNAFTSAIVGNHEAVRQYGIIITEATLGTELMAMGIEKGIKGATEQEKVQARLNLIMKGTSDAQGDAARTSDSWANTMRGLRTMIADTAADIGLKLLPILTPMLQQFTDMARSIGPEVVRQVTAMATAFASMGQVLGQIDLSSITAQFDSIEQSINVDFWSQVFGFIGQQIALTVTNFQELGFELSSIGQQFQAFGSFLKGDTSWSEYRARMQELQVEYDNAHAAFQTTYDKINSRNWGPAIEAVTEMARANDAAAARWQALADAAVPAAEEIATTVADSLGQLWEQVLPKDEEGWAAYLEQMTTAMTDSSSLLTEHSETQLGLIAEYGVRRAELALQEQEAVAALEAAGQEGSAARLSEYFDTMLEGLNDQYQARIDAEAGAQGILLDLQSGAQGTLLENLGAFMSEAAERYGSYAETIVSLEQERDNVLAFLEAQYQNERARLQVSGDNQSLSLLASAHQAKYGNVVAYYNQRIKTEQTGQRAVFNVAKAYYLQTLMMMRLQLVNQLKTVAGTMDALVRAMVGGYGAITAAAYAAKLAQEGKDLAAISSGIADVQNMMAALEGSGVAAAAQASVAFDDWKDTVDDLGGGLDGIGDKLGGIGDSVGGSGGVKEKIIDPIKEAADMAQRLAQMVDKAIGAFDLLSEYGGPTPGWIDGYRKLLEAVEVMVKMFAETTAHIVAAGLIAQKKREQLADSATLISGAIKVISDALKISEMLQDVELNTVDVTAILDRLTPQILAMTRAIVSISDTLAALGKNKLRDTSQAAEYIVDTMKPWSEAVKALSALATLPATDPTAAIQGVVEQIISLIRAMGDVTDEISRADLRRISQSATYVVDALKPWTSAVATIKALTDVPAMDISEVADRVLGDIMLLVEKLRFAQRQLDPAMMKDLAQGMAPLSELMKPWAEGVKAITALASLPASNVDEAGARLVESMFNLIRQMQSFGRMISREQLEDLARVAATWTEILKPWDTAAKVVKEIAESVAGDIGPAADLLVNQIFDLTRKLGSIARDMDQLELEELSKKAALLINALKPWEAAAKAVEAIAGGTWERVGPKAEKLVGQMFNLIRKLSLHSANIDRAELDRLGRLAQPLIDALKPWEAAAKAVDAIAGAAVGRIGPAAEMLVGQILGLVRKLGRIAGQIRPEDLSAAASAAALFVEALKPWEVAAKAVDGIGRTTGEKIGPQAERLVMQMVGLARKLARVARDMPAGQLQEAARVATLFSDSLKPWQEAMTVVQALSRFANSTRVGPQAERLVQQMMGLARKLARAGREVGLADLEFAARIGRLFGDVLEPWNKAITLSNDLRMWRELPDLQERMTRFARIWIDIVADLSKAVNTLSTQGMEAVAAFGRSLTDLMGGLQAALNVVSDFDFEPPDPAMWGNFQGWVQDTFTSFYAWVNAYGIPEPGMPPVPSFDEKGLTAVSLFAQALRDLMGGLEAALGIATDFEFQEPDPTMWSHFQSWVQSVFVSFYEWVNATAPPEPPMPGVPLFGGDGLAAVSAFAGALNSLMHGLQAALAIAKDFEFQTPDATQWSNFFTWVTGVFQAFYTDIITRYPSEDPTTTFAPVQAWGGALGALMGGLQSALAIAKDFEFVEPDATQWDAFFEWTTTTFEDFRAEIVRRYPSEDPTTTFAPVTAWGGALGALMGGLQSALAIAADFDFQEPDPDQWDAFFEWTTTVFEEFRAEIVRRYPADDPDQFAPVTAWANAFGALMSGLQSAISLVSEFDWQAPDPDDWDDFFDWTLEVLEAFRVAITTRYPSATAATWEPVVAWAGALGALMQALETAVTTADSFAFIPPDELGWGNFFTWTFRVFDDFRLEILERFPENPEEAGQFPAVIALSNAISAIFSGLQSALAFFMDLHGPGEAFWTFLAGAGGNPDTSPFRQRMGYIIGAITGTMAAFDAWVVQNAPTWTGNATQLLTRVTTITGILQDAIELFDFMDNTTLPSTADIQQFVTAVLQLFSSFAGELTNLVGSGGMGAHVNAVVNLVSGFVATTMPPLITSWHDAGAALVGGFVGGMADKIGPESVVGTVAYTIAEIRGELGEFTGWWVPNRGEGYWYDAGDALVDAFIEGMESNLGNPEGAVYNAAFAIGQAANAGLKAGAASGGSVGGGGYRPEGPAAGLGKAAAGTFGWSSPSVSSERNINLTIRFENAPANLDRRTLDELKRTLVYEIQRGA